MIEVIYLVATGAWKKNFFVSPGNKKDCDLKTKTTITVYPFYRWKKWGSARLSYLKLHTVTENIGGFELMAAFTGVRAFFFKPCSALSFDVMYPQNTIRKHY